MSRKRASKSQSNSSKPHKEINTIESLARQVFKPDYISIPVFTILILLIIVHYALSIYNFLPISAILPISVDHLPIAIDLTRFSTSLAAIIYIARKIFSAYESRELIITFFKNHPIQLFVSIIACGATTAFFLPLILNLFKFIGETDKLTTALLASTGGVIAVFTLIKTHQKNQTDEATLEHNKAVHAQQIKDRNYDIERQISERKEQKDQFDRNFNLQSSKNKQDHIHQAHTERRSRYTKAVEQLAHEKATVRLGGIYTLVGLVDEWLADGSIKEKDDRRKEGQVIINNLCAYIRSPFPLAKNRDILHPSNEVNYGNTFEEDSVRLREEQEIRLSIFTEISNHLTVPEKNSENKESTWNEFSYNYRESPIFYPLGNLKFVNPDFSGSEFYGEAVFHNSEFIGEANFTHTRFKGSAIFIKSHHNCITKFNNAVFHGDTYFIGVEFFSGVSFENSMYGRRIMFSEDSEKRAKKTAFSVKNNPKEYNFEIDGRAMVSKIETEQITVTDGRVFTIPVGCELFNPEPLPTLKPEEKPAK